MELCVIIPAKDEELTLTETIKNLQTKLNGIIPYSILVVNDHSDDGTLDLLASLASKYSNLKYVSNEWNGGVGSAIRYGLSKWQGDIVALCMADGSDAPEDILQSYHKITEEDFDCVFGSRFVKGGGVKNYPFIKLILNRIFNIWVRIVSGNKYNDFTNIFKVYHRRSIDAIAPLDSTGFNIGLEMSLKAFKQKLKIAVIPISWKQRKAGVSKLKLSKNVKLYMSTLNKSLKNNLLSKFALTLVLFTYLIFGLSHSAQQGFWHDEIYTLTFLKGVSVYDFEGSVWSDKEGIYDVNYFKGLLAEDHFYSNFSTQVLHEGHPPLYFILLKLWSYGFGTSEIALRSFSLFCGLLVFLVLFNLFKRRSKRRFTSWVILAMLVFNPFLYYFFTEARMYALAFLLATLSFRYWLEYIERKKIKSYAFLYFCLASIGLLYTHYYGLFFLISLAVFEVLKVGAKKSIFNHSVAVLCFLPWAFAIKEQLHFHNQHWTDGIITLGESALGYFKGILHLLISPMAEPLLHEQIITIVIVLLAVSLLLMKERKFTIILLSVIMIYGLQIFVFDQLVGHHSILVPRYYIFTLIFVYWGFYKMIDYTYSIASLIVAMTYIAITSTILVQLYKLERAPKQMFREVAGFVDSQLDLKTRVLVFEPKGPLMVGVSYYLQNNFKLMSADKAPNNLESSVVYIDENLGVPYREKKYNRKQQEKLELIPFVGVLLYK